MKVLDALSSGYWHAAGYAAARTGEYERALDCFERADCKRRQTPLRAAYKATVLMLLGRRAESQAAFRELAQAGRSNSPDDGYARLYAQLYVAYLDDDLVEADRLATELRGLKCRKSVKDLLITFDPATLKADSLLSSLGIDDADPLGFRGRGSGVHWIKAVETYSNGDNAQALDHISRAEAVQAATPAQKTLKAGLLLHLGRAEEADELFRQVIETVGDPRDVDERYARLFCELYRPSGQGQDRDAILRQAEELEPQTSLRHFLPLGGLSPDAVKAHFDGRSALYGRITVQASLGA